ncbi:hypothetical protein AVEN_203043-1 [Araneus ventricosus]|uniref:Uncharacterized protein n=1 Tax=Araneus ventricosus TaxID=182803 RepID=A0A4Y2JRW3_ARAVE|nr:hypothetical protein AVEN_203043-1 [Araneus ventricosus]
MNDPAPATINRTLWFPHYSPHYEQHMRRLLRQRPGQKGIELLLITSYLKVVVGHNAEAFFQNKALAFWPFVQSSALRHFRKKSDVRPNMAPWCEVNR